MIVGIIEIDGEKAESARLIFEMMNLRLDNQRLQNLVTAQPDLLEACERMVAQYGNADLTLSEQLVGYDLMIAAIAKAKGEK